jgi:manganese/zinc/iron transport system permease protein
MSFQGGYNTNLVIGSTMLLGLAAGLIGVFTLLRKRSLISDALSHATLPGIAGAFLIATALGFSGRTLPVLLIGAAITGVLGIFAVQWLLRSTRLREDAAIGLVLSVFFGVGIVLLSIIQTMPRGGSAGLTNFIYGQTAAMSLSDAWLMAAIAGTTVLTTLLLRKEFSLTCFNDSYAKVTGWPVSLIDVIMMTLLVLVTVAGLQAVGIILVIALLIIPAVAARFWTEHLLTMLIVAALIGAGSGYVGSITSALLPRQPAGAVIVLTCGAVFTLSMFFAPRRGLLAGLLRRGRLRLRIEMDHLLEAAYLANTEQPAPLTPAKVEQLRHDFNWPWWMLTLVRLAIRRRAFGSLQGEALTITQAGFERGRQVARNHQLWQHYLIAYADIATSTIDWTVDQVEHVLDPAIIQELERQIGSSSEMELIHATQGTRPIPEPNLPQKAPPNA